MYTSIRISAASRRGLIVAPAAPARLAVSSRLAVFRPRVEWRALSQPPRRPPLTKSHILAQTRGRLSRLLVHVKWPLKRNNRPFSADDMSAFASWVVMGNLLWIALGTTTFVLFGLYSVTVADSVWAAVGSGRRGLVGRLASSVLGHGLGLRLEFAGSVLPELHGGMLRFTNVNVSWRDRRQALEANVEQMDVSLSFGKWYEGRGLIDELEVYGMRCRVEMTAAAPAAPAAALAAAPTTWFYTSAGASGAGAGAGASANAKAGASGTASADASGTAAATATAASGGTAAATATAASGDNGYGASGASGDGHGAWLSPHYHLSHFKMHDSYIEIDSHHDTPLRISIFNCDLPEVNGNRLLIDFFNANNVTGAINDSMFTVHKHQRFHESSAKMVRFKLDGIDMGRMARRNPLSKFNWIVHGRAEVVADILLPQQAEEAFSLGLEYKRFAQTCSAVLADVMRNLCAPPSGAAAEGRDPLLRSAIGASYDTFAPAPQAPDERTVASEYVVVSFKIRLYDLQAALPAQLPSSSAGTPYLSLHHLRRLIAYVNGHFDAEGRPPLVVNTTVIEKFAHLYNTANLAQTKVLDLIVRDVYEDLTRMVNADEQRLVHERQNSWSHTVASQLLLLGLGVLA
ncbi:Mitochondrial distribution and morphology protein 31 [[Candida] zeylanoides]